MWDFFLTYQDTATVHQNLQWVHNAKTVGNENLKQTLETKNIP